MPVTDTHANDHANDITATAPGKIILCGEHSVVYGHPAIAVPVSDMRVHAHVRAADAGEGLRLRAPDIHETLRLQDAAADHPLGKAVRRRSFRSPRGWAAVQP